MSSEESGAPIALSDPWWLRPWTWALVGIALTGVAFAWARATGADDVPIDLIQFPLVVLGMLASGAGVWLRSARRRPAGLNDLAGVLRTRVLFALAVTLAATAVAVTALLIVKIGRPDLPGAVAGTLVLWLLAAPWCGYAAWVLVQRSKDAAPLNDGFETALLVTVGAMTALLGSWAFYWGPEYPEAWDSLRLFLAAASGFAFLAAPLVAAPPRLRRLGISALVIYHFVGITSAVLSATPGPWLFAQVHQWTFRYYLDFMYLNNAYRFYAPDPAPAYVLWCRIEYRHGEQVLSRWIKLPDVDENGNRNYPTGLEYTRMLCLAERGGQAGPMPPMTRMTPTGEVKAAEFVERRQKHLPEVQTKLGEKSDPKALRIPLHPDPQVTNYQRPTQEGQFVLSSYARYLLRQPHPSVPDARPVAVKFYRVQHRILLAETVAMGEDPRDPTYYVPYYMGKFDVTGRLVDPQDPFLYWALPILRIPGDPRTGTPDMIQYYVYLHAGDDKWVRPAPQSESSPRRDRLEISPSKR
jgi:hypothetical protein